MAILIYQERVYNQLNLCAQVSPTNDLKRSLNLIRTRSVRLYFENTKIRPLLFIKTKRDYNEEETNLIKDNVIRILEKQKKLFSLTLGESSVKSDLKKCISSVLDKNCIRKLPKCCCYFTIYYQTYNHRYK